MDKCMILLALTCILLGAVLGALLTVRIDGALERFIAKRERGVVIASTKPKTTKPVILDPDTMYLSEDKAENLRRITGATYDETPMP